MILARLTRIACRWAVCLVSLALMLPPRARADDCSVATDAAMAQVKVPHAVTHMMTMPGQPEQRVEIIFINEKTYTHMDGAWNVMPFSTKVMQDTIETSRKRAEQSPHTCQNVVGEPLNGEATTLLLVHSDANGRPSDAKIWISTSSGLPLRSEIRLADGAVVTDTFRYDNITVPPGAN
jgi:outer membrane lipoprotein-sorting protein